MKALLCTLTLLSATLLFGTDAHAVPVLNRSAPAGTNLVVFPDHQDPNLYYVNPTQLRLARNASGVPEFSYFEFKVGSWPSRTEGSIQSLLVPSVDNEQVEAAKDMIRRTNPAAVFAALPFHEAHLTMTSKLEGMVYPNSCAHRAGVMGQTQSCSIRLTSAGVRTLRPMLRKGVTIALQFEYLISGFIVNADGTFQATEMPMAIGGQLGGKELADHPELFRFRR
jgi:hypothetical protein